MEVNPNQNQIQETPKWFDEEDQDIMISLNKKNNLKKLKKEGDGEEITGSEFQERLREQFTKMNNQTEIYNWAYDKDMDNDMDNYESDGLEGLLKTNKKVININNQNTSNKDPSTINESYSSILKIKQLPDLNKDNKHNSVVTNVCFHPSKDTIGFTTGLDKKLKLFSVNEIDNTSSNIQTVNTIDMPIVSAGFLNESEVLMSGKRKYFYTHNIESNKLTKSNGVFSNKNVTSLEKMFVGERNFAFGTNEGYILLFDSKNKIYKHDVKISGSVNSVCFDRNGINMYAVGDQSEIYVFDVRKYRNCVTKFNDSGNFNTSYMGISRDNEFLATGKIFKN